MDKERLTQLTQASVPLLRRLHAQVPEITSVSLVLQKTKKCGKARVPHYCVGFSTKDAGVIGAAKNRIEKKWEGVPVSICEG